MNTAPDLAAPAPLERRLSLLRFARMIRDNSIAVFRPEAYEQPILSSRLLWRRTFTLNDPAGIRHVMLENAGNYQKTDIARRLLEPGLGRGLLTSEGETWRRHRRIMSPAFDPRSVKASARVMTEATEQLLEEWDALPPGQSLDMAAAMMRLTLVIISRAMFSADSGGIVDVVEAGVERYQGEVRPTLRDLLGFPSWLPGGRPSGSYALAAFDHAIDRMITERTAELAADPQAAPRDLLSRLIAARDDETGTGMTGREVRDQVVTIFLAGHETTALALTWSWYLLSQHPTERALLDAELDRVLAGRTPGADDLPKLPYLRMVIEETLRLYPPAHTMSRQPIEDDVVSGVRIPRGSTILIVPWLLHRHRLLWEEPGRFRPERFAPEQAAKRERFSYLPFGAGPRICIGATFAMTEAMLILATLAQRYHAHLLPGFPVEPQGLITLRARHGLQLVLERR